MIYSPGWQILEERLYEDDAAEYDRLLLVVQNVWGLRYIDDLVARRVRRGAAGTTYTPPDGSWSHGDLALTLSDSMFSVRRIIGDDWGSTSHSIWLRERASLEVDYAAYGEPDAIVGLATDPWVDFTGDGIIDFFDTQVFLAHLSGEDPEADRNNDTEWDYLDYQLYLTDTATALQPLSPTGRRNAEENPFGLAGYRHDTVTGLYHIRNRVLDPVQGRWLQRDPAGFVDGGNLYGYVKANPVSAFDSTGMVTTKSLSDRVTGVLGQVHSIRLSDA